MLFNYHVGYFITTIPITCALHSWQLPSKYKVGHALQQISQINKLTIRAGLNIIATEVP